MHRLLERYTALLCAESIRRGEQRARLAAIVLRKRALSSAASLAVSCRRRLALLTGEPAASADEQLVLPLDEDDGLQEDDEPGSILAAPGLANAADERRWLENVLAAASVATGHESKTARLVRFLARVKEPVIVFTEYRDTLGRLSDVLRPHHPDLAMLHGGMTASERSATQQRFNQTGSLLLATDAAAEGLNLHRRCRTVIQFELPWSPARLEQRTGRVDRIGQSRPVHEILFVASDTAERLVLAPLATRASRAGKLAAAGPRLLAALSESRIASAIMEGTPLAPAETPSQLPMDLATLQLRTAADLEAARLLELRRFSRFSTSGVVATGIPASVVRVQRPTFPPGIVRVCTLTLTSQDGATVHREIVAIHEPEEIEEIRTPSQVRDRMARLDFWLLGPPPLTELLFGDRIRQVTDRCGKVAAALMERERVMCSPLTSAARQLVQAGLFDRRAIRAGNERERSSAALLEDANERMSALSSRSRLTPSLKVIAILLVANRRLS